MNDDRTEVLKSPSLEAKPRSGRHQEPSSASGSSGPSTRSALEFGRPPTWGARAVFSRLEKLTEGRLIVTWEGGQRSFGRAAVDGLEASFHVVDRRLWAAIALRGTIGAGEAWSKGWWVSDDPASVVRLIARNLEANRKLESGLAKLSRPALAWFHRLRENTLHGSRENISAHYDLSNRFFALFLDPTMTYSCGLFETPEATLEQASLAKIDRLLTALDVRPGHRLLEIGTGWGALAQRAAEKFGARVTTTTISAEQHAFATERIRKAGLGDRVELLLRDYRELDGRYDRIVSVEMIEAVGHRYYGAFFESCSGLLAENGRLGLQAITIRDSAYEEARRSVDFIQRHIFPGSCIPSISALQEAQSRNTDLRTVELFDMGLHYARTLSEWRSALRERWEEAQVLGFDEDFLRLFEFYFVYCEGGFAEGHISTVQWISERPAAVLDRRTAIEGS